MKKCIFCALLLPCLIFAATPIVIENPQVLFYVNENLPHEGALKQTEEGFLYIELPKEYIYEILPLIGISNICPPPYFGKGRVGAHITVATAEEITLLNFPVIPHLGTTIPFSIGNLYQVKLENSSLGREVYVLTIDSPEFSEIRAGLGLSPKCRGFDFHITIGVHCKNRST